MAKQVLIVEDSQPFATGLAMILNSDPGLSVCGIAGDIPDALAFAPPDGVIDLVIVDINLPSGSGLSLIPLLRSIHPGARFLVYSMEDPRVFARPAQEAGSAGYLRKGAQRDRILEAVSVILDGGKYFPDPGAT